MNRIQAVVFDVGETLVDETRAWGVWADHLGVPRLTFFAALGQVVAEGRYHRDVFELFAPGIDVAAEARKLGVAGKSDLVSLDDLYPDALPCLHELATDGYRLAIAGNQPAPAADVLAEMSVEFEFIGTSAGWGIEKPAPAFFERIGRELDLEPHQIAYVGDRVDNDVRPAHAAGMTAVFIRRGPWAWIQAAREHPPEADIVVESLAALPGALRRLG
ncbi:MAG TPA: HAD family hydrolase [Candidatus Limnocylindrales bacterium]|nr:HAD family hydrolase [Candidatus Limnocylindrales bacterium]